MHVQPNVNFGGRADKALAFHAGKLGARIDCITCFKAPPDADHAPAQWRNTVLPVALSVGQSQLLGSDGMPGIPQSDYPGEALTITAGDLAGAQRIFDTLTGGGNVMTPFGATFWSMGFGMLMDRFGIGWMASAPRQRPIQTIDDTPFCSCFDDTRRAIGCAGANGGPLAALPLVRHRRRLLRLP